MEEEQEQEQENNSTDETSRLKIKEDYISKLPYEVLAQILSIYPLDSGSKAVAIFTGLWNRPCIQHKGRTVKLQDFESIISSFLVNFDENNPLKKPRKLEFHFDRGSIVTASIGLNKKLNLDFSKGKQEFPRQFGWEIVLNTLDFAQPSPYPFSVKTLRLTSVNYLSCELVSSLINKFRYVETLIIDKCNGLRSLKVEGLAKLTNLIVRDCVDLKSVFIQTLELKTLRYGGPLCWFSLKNVMYLEDVMLDFECPGFIHLNHHLYNPLLRAIRDVKVLTFHGWMFKDVFGPLLFSKQNEEHFRFSKLEDLWWVDSCMEDHNINWLFCFLKFCTSLKRLFITIDPRSYSTPSAGDNERPIKVQKGQLRKLKMVKLEGFKEEEDAMLLKERMLEVFGAEPRVVDVSQGMHTRCLIRIPKRQAFGKEKESKKVKFHYKFVEEVEGNGGLCSKHPHMP
ncbi:F-box protein At2g39490 [Lactuca sativa]|uniref:At1g61320/AtMIF1 LRR domain-containing protein n=1 Tax=Lactuca sativa TaxID=4236 RepID=A0A9R1UPX0_LACSA|nr:F-box protein At2g39490 [Lactuca sativa]XP_052623064.1 F-box protein At2g39490 [Lactuca sativa]KAJ0191525.1 hypothetical protein LSAT_V11C800395770 [Lactuca sativa]